MLISQKVAALCAMAFFSCCNPLLAQEWYVSYKKALEAVRKQQWQQAVTQLNAALAAKPESKANTRTYGMEFIDYFPYLYRGMAYYNLGDFGRASADLEKEDRAGEVRKAVSDKTAANNLRNYLNLIKQRQLAAAKYNDALDLFNQKEYAEAKNGFEEVRRLDPKNAEAARYLKLIENIENEKVNPGPAITEITKENKMKAERDNEFKLGTQFYGQRNFDEAKKRFNRVLELDPAFSGARDYLKKIEAESAMASVGARIQPVFNEGVQLYEEGDLDSAEAKFKKVLELDQNYATAITYLNKISADRAKEVEKKFQEGVRFYNNKQWDQAEKAFLAVLRLNKNNVRARSYIDEINEIPSNPEPPLSQRVESLLEDGEAFFKSGDLKNAKIKFSAVQRLELANATARERLNAIAQVEQKIRDGVAAFYEGAHDQAIAQLNDAVRVYGANTEARAFLSCAFVSKYFLSGEENETLYQNAVNQFSEVRRLDAGYKLNGSLISPKIIAVLEKN